MMVRKALNLFTHTLSVCWRDLETDLERERCRIREKETETVKQTEEGSGNTCYGSAFYIGPRP